MTGTARAPSTDHGLDPEVCYRASAGRDARWDGRFVVAVVTTSVYCRPSCPARKPHQRNCRFFLTPAGAVAAGFRACKRCRPDALPGSRQWDVRADLAARAVQLIRDGMLDEVGVAGLAARLSVSERHLHRVLVAEVGASPTQLNRTRRAQTARMLIEQTALSMADVAFAAGFDSVRQFNDVIQQEFAATPSALRRSSRAQPAAHDEPVTGGLAHLRLRLRYRPPLERDALVRFLAAHAVPGLETHDAVERSLTRLVPTGETHALVTASLGAAADTIDPAGGVVDVRLALSDVSSIASVVSRVRRWLDLDADPLLVQDVLSTDPELRPLVHGRPGLRVPGCVDGSEMALLAVLTQQASVTAARSVAARIVSAFGTPGTACSDELAAFPHPVVLADAGPDTIRAETGVTNARARTVHALAVALAEGLRLEPGADRDAARARLVGLPGIGRRTAEYIALRALGDPDAFPSQDLGLRRALRLDTRREVEERSQAWRPWRGYAVMHLWAQALFRAPSGGDVSTARSGDRQTPH